jgi:SET domain-containing protein
MDSTLWSRTPLATRPSRHDTRAFATEDPDEDAIAIPHTQSQRDPQRPIFETRPIRAGRGIFACRPIAAGIPLFGEDDWADEAERRIFSTLSAAQLDSLSPSVRKIFLHFAYNTGRQEITGTFKPEAVRHPANFINHSCEPNAGYDGEKTIVTLRRIWPGEEIRMDYGTYSFSFDHEFTCACGAWGCRGKVRRDDWPGLVRAGLRVPGFMRAEADRVLWG